MTSIAGIVQQRKKDGKDPNLGRNPPPLWTEIFGEHAVTSVPTVEAIAKSINQNAGIDAY